MAKMPIQRVKFTAKFPPVAVWLLAEASGATGVVLRSAQSANSVLLQYTCLVEKVPQPKILDFPKPDELCFQEFYMRPPQQRSLTGRIRLRLAYLKVLKRCVFSSGERGDVAQEGMGSRRLLVVLGTKNHKAVYDSFAEYLQCKVEHWGSAGNLKRPNWPRLPQPSLSARTQLLIYLVLQEFKNKNFRKTHVPREQVYRVYILMIQFERALAESNFFGVVLFNDHVFWYRALLFAAKRTCIPVIYVPHASVSYRFPPLAFDLALLEGSDMANKYRSIGPVSGKIKLVGNPKFDDVRARKIPKYSQPIERLHIGFAFNHRDELASISELGATVHNRVAMDQKFRSVEVVIRPHPALASVLKDFVLPPCLNVSDSAHESSVEFLCNLNLLITTGSNIILESLMVGTPVIYVEPVPRAYTDNYGFVKNGIVNEPVTNTVDLLTAVEAICKESLEVPASVRTKLSYYNAAIGQHWEGAVGKRIAEEIERYTCSHNSGLW